MRPVGSGLGRIDLLQTW